MKHLQYFTKYLPTLTIKDQLKNENETLNIKYVVGFLIKDKISKSEKTRQES